MQRIYTALTDLLGINAPIVAPPMAFASGGRLAAQVTLGGGFGFAASGLSDAASFARELDEARSVLSTPHEAPLQLGAGYLGWMLDQGGNPVDCLHVALERRVSSIWLSFGDDLGKWVEHIRQYDQSRKDTYRTLIWILVNSVAEAEVAIKQWKADVLVVQGIEAGGHGQSQALPLVTLLSLIKQSLPDLPPLVAAGGLANGAQVAAMLVLGASGAAVGTRFLATPESTYTINQKNAVLAATHSVRTHLFDQVRGTVGWPLGVDGRAIPNQTLEDEASGVEPEELKKRFVEAVKKDDTSRSVVWSGASVGLVHEISGAEALTREIGMEIMMHLRQASNMITDK
ncbi:2-nitropropane dioxygenase [Gautieria morchelliformis]|nr:2-nitropropane dioxygenase [Gautieria morchelliformis]